MPAGWRGDIPMTGAELYRWRKYVLKISQIDLADKLDLGRRTIQAWEAGDELALRDCYALAALKEQLPPL